MFTLRTHRGFTLVELLVVISIIAILASIVYANFNQARQAARDDIRRSALKELQLAVELYNAQEDTYPAALTDLAPDFIQEVPTDPFSGVPYDYITNGSNSYYKIFTDEVESVTVDSYQDEFARCPSQCGSGACSTATPPANTYAVYSIGAECE